MKKATDKNASLITVKCDGCGGVFDCPARFAGKRVKCPKCGESFTASEHRPESISKPPAKPKTLAVRPAADKHSSSVCGLAVASLALGVIACVTCWVPIVGGVCVPVALMGIFFGISGGVVSIATKKTDGYLAGCGIFVCLTALCVFMAVTGWVSMEADRLAGEISGGDSIVAEVRTDGETVFVTNGQANAWFDVTMTVGEYVYRCGMLPGRETTEIRASSFRDKDGGRLDLNDFDDLDIYIECDQGKTWAR